MAGALREMRMRSLVPLHRRIVVTNRKSVRSKNPADKATAVGLSGSATERGQIAGSLVDRAVSATDRTIDRKGKIGKEARRG